jgi:serine/threonine protein kinase/formylglycine-generating enzyme required for sulfatase activity
MTQEKNTSSFSEAGYAEEANAQVEYVPSGEGVCELTKRFVWKKKLGQGGMGTVHLVHDSLLERDVVLKQIRKEYLGNENYVKLFLREASMAIQLSHPNIVHTSEVHFFQLEAAREITPGRWQRYLEDPCYIILMEYIDGKDLKKLSEKNCYHKCAAIPCRGKCLLPLETIKRIALNLCDALDAAHSKGILHRDLKLGNIFCRQSNDRHITEALLADFGLARKLPTSDNPMSANQMGTVLYMPPEQLGGVMFGSLRQDHRIDLFALGVVLYRLLTGMHPYMSPEVSRQCDSSSSQIIYLSRLFNGLLENPDNEELRPRSISDVRSSLGLLGVEQQISTYIDRAVRMCLEPDPERRPSSAKELRNLLSQEWQASLQRAKERHEIYLDEAWGELAFGRLDSAKLKIGQAKGVYSSDLSLSKKDINEVLTIMQRCENTRTNELQKLQDERSNLQDQLTALNVQIDEQNAQISEQEQVNQSLKTHKLAITDRYAKNQSQIQILESEKQSLQNNISQIEGHLQTQRDELKNAEQLNQKLTKENQKQSAKIESLDHEVGLLRQGKAYRRISGMMWFALLLCVAIAAGAGFLMGWQYKEISQPVRQSTDIGHQPTPKERTATPAPKERTATPAPKERTALPELRFEPIRDNSPMPVELSNCRKNEKGYDECQNLRDGAWMVQIPSGKFYMGSTYADKNAYTAEKPQLHLHLDEYWIDKYEVSVELFRKCVKAGQCNTASFKTQSTGGNVCNYGAKGREDHPMNCVDWHGAKAYCLWANKELCNEAEWEKAARGIDKHIYPWGKDSPNCQRARYSACGSGTVSVDSLPVGASPYGVFNMAGNVFEWVLDCHDLDYYEKLFSKKKSHYKVNKGGSECTQYVRGGSWGNLAMNLRAAYRNRNWGYPISMNGYYGLRCCART